MNHVLVIHHDADLYGSDKSLLRSLRALKSSEFSPIVVLPHHGPLFDVLNEEGIEVHIGPVGKLSRKSLRPLAIPSLVLDVVRAVRFLSSIVVSRSVVLAYSNSIAVLGGAIWAIFNRVPRLWHVREIVVTPKIASSGFPFMLSILGGWCVCNSHATRQWITNEQSVLLARSSVIWNGLEDVAPPRIEDASAFRDKIGVARDELIVTLVGRINRWKGQDVFIDACSSLLKKGVTGFRFLIVGDVADGQHQFRESMLDKINRLGLASTVIWHPFTTNVDIVWAASDVAVVPSIEPEPFGRVAIEAMAHGLPVIAAEHGGLLEIVEQDVTGLFVKPGDVEELASAIEALLLNHEMRKIFGQNGKDRQRRFFSQSEHDRSLINLFRRLSCDPH